MPAWKINPFTALTRIRSQFLRTQWSTSNHSEWTRLRIRPLSHRGWPHHQGIFPGSTRFTPVQSLPVRPGIVPGSQKYICSPIITVHYGLPRSTHVNTQSNKSGSSRWTPVLSRWTLVSSRWTPGSSRSTYGGHPVHPGQHTVRYGSLRFNTVPYGSLRFIPVNTRLITVHYSSLRFITGIVTIPVNTRFITVHYGSSRSTPASSRSTPGLNFLPGLMPVRPNYQTCLIL